MREIILTLPLGNWEAHCQLASEILGIAGGYTECDATGVWRDDAGKVYREKVKRYIVGVKDPVMALQCIKALAKAGDVIGEQCVYYVGYDGEAHIVYHRQGE